jgi:hypothetical protein
LLVWLTVNLPDLCISVYTDTTPPPMAPARPRASARISLCIGAYACIMGIYVGHQRIMRGKTLAFLRVSANVSTVMVSVAMMIDVK